MKSIILTIVFLFLCQNFIFGQDNNYKREDKAYSIHMEALGESDYAKAMANYNILTKIYSDTEYYRNNRENIEEEMKNLKENKEKEIKEQVEMEIEERHKKKEEEEERQRKKEEERLKKLERERKEYAEKLIKEHKIAPGMTQEETIRSWGEPDKINKSVYGDSIHEQWIYYYKEYNSVLEMYVTKTTQYLYFTDGILTSWQRSE